MKYTVLLSVLATILGARVVAAEETGSNQSGGGAGGTGTGSSQGTGSNSNSNAQSSGSSSSSVSYSSEYDYIEFTNFGYDGYYYNVKLLDDPDSEDCSCTLSTSETKFSGSNAPLDGELSVHFRGPLTLSKFAFYVADDYVFNDDTSANWTRLAYYDSSEQTADNVTFLTAAGTNSSCLGKLITYAADDGQTELNSSTILADGTLINSDEEYMIFSNVSCDDSGYKKDCGVYRSGIPLYHGFYGETKMFIFEFTLPTENVLSEDDVESYYDMPLIWLLNAHIPRTAQYPSNSNCSCWTSGCGEFDIFEVMNSSTTSKFFSTIHDYQGTGDIDDGIQLQAYLKRDTEGTMRGGVLFDSNGTLIVFMTNDTEFDSTLSGSDLHTWIKDSGTYYTDELDSVSSSSSSSSAGSSSWNVSGRLIMTLIGIYVLMFVL